MRDEICGEAALHAETAHMLEVVEGLGLRRPGLFWG